MPSFESLIVPVCRYWTKLRGGYYDFRISGQSFINENCCKPVMILTWNLDQQLKLTSETRQRQKKLTMTSCQQTQLSNSQLMTNLEQSGSWIPDTWSVKLTFSLIVTFYLTKTENRSEQALILLLSVKVLFLLISAILMRSCY